jgi:hypothetical protein
LNLTFSIFFTFFFFYLFLTLFYLHFFFWFYILFAFYSKEKSQKLYFYFNFRFYFRFFSKIIFIHYFMHFLPKKESKNHKKFKKSQHNQKGKNLAIMANQSQWGRPSFTNKPHLIHIIPFQITQSTLKPT